MTIAACDQVVTIPWSPVTDGRLAAGGWDLAKAGLQNLSIQKTENSDAAASQHRHRAEGGANNEIDQSR